MHTGTEGPHNRITHVIAAGLIALLVILCLVSMRFNAPTSDEQNHVSRGYHYLVTGNLDLNVAPPFVNMLSGIPLLFKRGVVLPSYDLTHSKTYINEFAEDFVWVYNDAETVINLGRLSVIALSAVLAWFVFSWARDLWGAGAGLMALFLYVLDPNILAHSQLATTDLGVACFIFVATYYLWRFVRWRRNRDLVLSGTIVGLALATKLSALLLLPIVVTILVLELLLVRDTTLRGRWPWRQRFTSTRWGPPAYWLGAAIGVVVLMAFVSMWAAYRFEAAPLAEPKQNHATVDRLVPVEALRPIAYRIIETVPAPFPSYLRGIRWLQRYADRGAPAFLMGSHATKGWWYYFLVAFAIKTPLPTLLLMAAVALRAARRGWSLEKHEYVVYVPIAAFFGATLFSFLNIGYRHILPVLPFIFVAVGQVSTWTRTRWARIALLALLLWYAASGFAIFPHYLAYFNESVGGPDNGYRYLVDSNLDWGQDLKGLKAYMDQNGLDRIRLAYFGSAHPEYYGIQVDALPMEKPADLEQHETAVYAISATFLQSGYLGDTEAFSWLRAYRPLAKIGYSIFLYRLP